MRRDHAEMRHASTTSCYIINRWQPIAVISLLFKSSDPVSDFPGWDWPSYSDLRPCYYGRCFITIIWLETFKEGNVNSNFFFNDNPINSRIWPGSKEFYKLWGSSKSLWQLPRDLWELQMRHSENELPKATVKKSRPKFQESQTTHLFTSQLNRQEPSTIPIDSDEIPSFQLICWNRPTKFLAILRSLGETKDSLCDPDGTIWRFFVTIDHFQRERERETERETEKSRRKTTKKKTSCVQNRFLRFFWVGET